MTKGPFSTGFTVACATLVLSLVAPDGQRLSAQPGNLVLSGLPAGISGEPPPRFDAYRSPIDFPPFVDWDRGGRGLLFNGGSILYAMPHSGGSIEEKARLRHYLDDYLSPMQDRFLFLEDADGDERFRLFLYDMASHATVAVTPEGTRSTGPLWRSDGRQFLYKSNQRDPAQADLYIADTDQPTQGRLLVKDIGDEAVLHDWDLAGGRVLLSKVISENRKPLFLLDLATAALTPLDPAREMAAFPLAEFVNGGRSLIAVSDRDGEFLQLHRYDLASRGFINLTPSLMHDIDEIAIAPNGRTVAFAANVNGRSMLYGMDLLSRRYRRADAFPAGVIDNLRFAPDGNRVAFNLSGGTFRRKVFTYSFRSGRLARWANGRDAARQPAFVAPEAVAIRVPPRNGRAAYTIHGFLYRPRGTTAAPVYIDIHGGPEYQARPVFNRWHQYLVGELKIAVLVPNISGSSGYGRTFMMADDGQKRQAAIDDIGHVLDWIGTQPGLDPKRVALFGESYGGFMVLSALARFPDRIRCGIDVAGIANLVSFLERTALYRRDLRRVEFGDERDPETRRFLTTISPLSHASGMTVPLMVVQGRNDPRVDYRESGEMVRSVRERGGIVWSIEAGNEGHGFHRPENHAFRLNAEIAFLRRYLLN